MSATSAKMPKPFLPMFTGLSSHSAKCAKTDSGTAEGALVPECHNTLDYGTGTGTTGRSQLRGAKVIVVHLRPLAGNYQAPPDKRLARLLKCALRAFGFRCESCREVEP
jgi:hypothetical protein